MDIHVDLVKNEWLAGFQYLVARVFIEGGQVTVDSPEPWASEVVMRPLRDEKGEVHAEKDPKLFLTMLSEGIHGTYLFATEPHADTDCAYVHHPVVPMEPAPEEERLPRARRLLGAIIRPRT